MSPKPAFAVRSLNDAQVFRLDGFSELLQGRACEDVFLLGFFLFARSPPTKRRGFSYRHWQMIASFVLFPPLPLLHSRLPYFLKRFKITA